MGDQFLCLDCSSPVPLRPHVRGKRPQFCSDDCRKKYRRDYLQRWCAENSTKVAQRRDENRDQVRAWNREFYARNKERRQKLRRDIYHANPEKALAAAKVYSEQNPERIRALSRKSRATRRSRILEAFVEVVDPVVVFKRDAGICGICKKPVDVQSKWHVDHVTPLAKGGIHAYANVQLAHGRCNRSKGARHYTLF